MTHQGMPSDRATVPRGSMAAGEDLSLRIHRIGRAALQGWAGRGRRAGGGGSETSHSQFPSTISALQMNVKVERNRAVGTKQNCRRKSEACVCRDAVYEYVARDTSHKDAASRLTGGSDDVTADLVHDHDAPVGDGDRVLPTET